MRKLDSSQIAVIGLGYVGLPLAVEFGKHYSTLGFDINKRRVAELKRGIDVTAEVGKSELSASSNLKFVTEAEQLFACNVFIVTVPTPIDDAHRPDLEPLRRATSLVAKLLKKCDVVIFESTVFPGCTEEVCVPILERESGLVFNEDFHCGYSPERINPGDKRHRITTIKKVTSGSTKESAEFVDSLYASIIDAGTYPASSLKVAEAAKVIENTQRDLNIALVNELSLIFERLEIDTIEVLQAAESKWNFLPFRPGLVGGHCIGVDPYYLTHKADQVGYQAQVILAGRRINANMGCHVARSVVQRMLQNGYDVPRCTVAVLGLTFKENCPDIRNSQAFDLVRELRAWNVDVVVEDPWADLANAEHEYGVCLNVLEDQQVDAVIVAVAHDEFRNRTLQQLRAICRGESPVLADLKALYDRGAAEAAGFTVFRL